MDWTLETGRTDGAQSVTPGGELDLLTAPLLARALREVEQDGAGPIVLDLTRVTFMDSSGLAVLLEAVSRSRTRGGDDLSIRIGRAGVVVRVLELADLLDDLPVVRA